ncbi:acyltransferase family protein [Ilumatobacter sp.]|uniref:acyltransferase family protein n=1 Tax=Ilumatobacter sp. TaxID=1967498 RepID=UPI003C6B319F
MTDTRLASTVASSSAGTVERIPYQPALDGVRAIAVIAVVAFHSGARWASGGYLGVSVFFTLSGYLITTVLLAEHASTGRIALGTFVGRRLRRLAPASLLTLGALTVLAIAGIGTAAADSARHLRWAAAHLANWDQLTAGSTYADAVSGAAERSPVLHFWSLAIEEQFYLVWPIVMIVGLALLRRFDRGHFVVVPAVALIASWVFVAFLANGGEAERIYLHSGSRAAEVLTGCLLAVVLRHRPSITPNRFPLAPVCGLAIVAAIVLTGSSSSAWPYRGGLPIFALLSAGLIVGLGRPSRFSGVVGSGPLVWIGRRSYGIYLYHWPIFVLVPLVGAGIAAHALRLVAVVAVAAVSYRWIEQPIRTRATGTAQTVALAVGGAVVVIGATFLIDGGDASITTRDEIDADVRSAVEISGDVDPAPVDTAPVDTAAAVGAEQLTGTEPSVTTELQPVAADPFRIVVVGDSTAVAMSAGLVDWAESTDGEVQVGIAAYGACGLVRGGEYTDPTFNAALSMLCPAALDRELPDILETAPIDLVVVMVSLADTWERSWDEGATWTTPTDPGHAARLRDDYEAFVDEVTARGARQVVFVRPPVAYVTEELDEPRSEWTSGSQQIVEDTVAAIVAEHDEVVVLDMREYFEESGFDADHTERPDGIHLSADGSADLAESWLGPALLDLQNP